MSQAFKADRAGFPESDVRASAAPDRRLRDVVSSALIPAAAPHPFGLTLISNDVAFASASIDTGVDRMLVDLERKGKAERYIEMPPLGKRREDIPLLVAHFLEQIAQETGSRKIYAPEAVELLATAEWPGNIRQLHNVVRQNVALTRTPIITAELVQQSLGGSPSRLPSFDEARDEFTRSYLAQILQITAGNVSQAARLAKRNRTDFYKLLARHQLVPDDFKAR